MKTLTLKRIALTVLLGGALAIPVLAQPGNGMGRGQGPQASAPGAGMNAQARGMRGGQNGTPGWTLLTQEERTAQQAKMRQVKTVEECKALQTEQRKVIEARAKEKGVTLPTPRQNGCDNMKARGWIK